MSENLDRRIAAALADEAVNLAKLFELLQETDAAVSAAVATAEQERQKSLDPALSPDPKAARQGMEDAVFAADRLRAVLPRLQRRYESAAHAQRKAEWVKKYDAVKVEHDAAVAELTQLYPTLVDQLVDLLSRIREVDGRPFPEAGEPDDGHHLPMVECAARSLIGTTIGGQWDTRLSLDRDLVLPDFGAPTKKAWPPHEVPVALQLALAHR